MMQNSRPFLSYLPIKRVALLALALVLQGCHSAFIQATVKNDTGAPVHLFEVDYPNASFGGQDLSPGATFRYRFKLLGDGSAKILWTDSTEHDHTSQGPALKEGQEGTLAITIGPSGATWEPHLSQAH